MQILKRKLSSKCCMACREASISSNIYCIRLGEYVDDVVYCPYFEPRSIAILKTAT